LVLRQTATSPKKASITLTCVSQTSLVNRYHRLSEHKVLLIGTRCQQCVRLDPSMSTHLKGARLSRLSGCLADLETPFLVPVAGVRQVENRVGFWCVLVQRHSMLFWRLSPFAFCFAAVPFCVCVLFFSMMELLLPAREGFPFVGFLSLLFWS